MKPSIAVILLAAAALGCAQPPPEPAGPKTFTMQLGEYMTKLEANYTAFEPDSLARDNACRRLVWSMLAMPADPAEHQELSDRFAAALAASDEFRLCDRNVMLIGSQAMKDTPPADRSYLMVLADKVNNARRPDAPAPYKTEYSSLAVGIIVDCVDYPHRVDTYDDRVNHAQWDRLHAWLDENLQQLELDPVSKRYRLPGATDAARTRPRPTMDTPGR